MRKSPRDRRLEADFAAISKLQNESNILTFEASGNPPQRYRLIFHGLGFARNAKTGEVVIQDEHHVLVELGAAYPRLVPNLGWQTPVFHPNISNNGVVCLGGYGTHWVPSLTLDEMATMLWDMIRYKNFDSESPYNRDAALWAKMQTDYKFPVDVRSIRDKIASPNFRLSNATDAANTVEAELVDPVKEVIDTGIEIIETPQERRPPADDGIVFLD